jgi:PAS domain S-box-containing protein
MVTKELRRESPPVEGHRTKIVVAVDDQPEILVALRRVLREEPYELVTFSAPAEALEWMTTHPVDLLIADERMPVMRGSDLMERLQASSPETLRVLLTGYPGSSTVEYGLSHGIDWLISKPWNDAALRITIRQLLEDREARARAAEPSGAPDRDHDWGVFADQAPVAMQTFDPEGRIRWANRAQLQMLGYAPDAYIGHKAREFFGDPGRFDQFLQGSVNSGAVQSCEARVLKKDGSFVDVLLEANSEWRHGSCARIRCAMMLHASRSEEDALLRTREELEAEVSERTRVLQETNYELVREIAERKRAQDTQRLSEERFRLLVDSVKDYSIFMLSPEGIVVSWNSGAERTKGYAAEEILGRDFATFFTPEDIAAGKPAALLEKAAKEGQVQYEDWRVRKDGLRIWCSIVITALRDSGGRLIGYAKVTGDLSERRKLEEERSRLQVSMLQGQKLQAIGQLSAGIAHEINNPVGYILSNLNTMGEYCQDLVRLMAAATAAARAKQEGGDPGPSLDQYARIAKDIHAEHLLGDLGEIVSDCKLGGEKIRDIVRSLREFAHIDPSEIRPLDLNKVLDESLRLSWNELKYKAEVRKDYAALPPVNGYGQRLEQVFVNLLVNAGQAIEKKGTVYISTELDGAEAVVRIRDTGRGIPPDQMAKIFEPFFTTKGVGAGTGLGLHVAYKIITAHRGRIEVESEVGKGTTFTVRIPLEGVRLG